MLPGPDIVLLKQPWSNFLASKHVPHTLTQLAHLHVSPWGFCFLYNCAFPSHIFCGPVHAVGQSKEVGSGYQAISYFLLSLAWVSFCLSHASSIRSMSRCDAASLRP